MKLRTRLLGAVAFTALAFAVVVATSVSVARDVEDRLVRIQRHQVPRLELGPQLEADFALLKRSYQDAVAAHDSELLARTSELRDRLVADLERGAPLVDPDRLAEVRRAVREAHEAALDVSRQLIGGRGDDETVSAIAAMQAKQARAQELIGGLTAFSHEELRADFDAAYRAEHRGGQTELAVMLASLVLVLALSLWNARHVAGALSRLEGGFARFGAGRLDEAIAVEGADELAAVATGANRMASRLAEASAEREARDWVRAGLVELGNELRGELDESEVATRAARALARRAGAVAAAVYVRDASDPPLLRLRGHHALDVGPEPGKAQPAFGLGEGLVGEAARGTEIVVVDDVPPDFLRVRSGLGEGAPARLLLVPVATGGKVGGVLELATFKPLTAEARELLHAAGESVAIALGVAQSRAATDRLLEQTQAQAARLLEQEEEVRTTNEELRATNEELAAQRGVLEARNTELQEFGRRLEQKAEELTMVSAYKSQFLANMSHELRTPLNSMLLLSKLLGENAERNLTPKQVEYARTVHGAGKDLLLLINQVLDLTAVEAGKQPLALGAVAVAEVADQMRRIFEPLATEKELAFEVTLEPDVPREIVTDRQRLCQTLTNLLGNAIKFTDRGSVSLQIALRGAEIAFAVRDTGPGIASEHHARVFQPFEQVDGSARRKHGGTGLGLGIARDLANLLGGSLRLDSAPGRGSVFTCLLPAHPRAATATANEARASTASVPPENEVLVIEPVPVLTARLDEIGVAARAVSDVEEAFAAIARQRFACLVVDLGLVDPSAPAWIDRLDALGAEAPALVVYASRPVGRVEAARLERRAEAVVMQEGASTDRLLDEIRLVVGRHEQGHDVADVGEQAPGVRLGDRKLLVVDDDMRTVYALSALLQARGANVVVADTGAVALGMLDDNPDIDAVLMDLMMPEMDGYEATRRIRAQARFADLPIIALTAKATKGDEQACLEAGATDYLAKPIDAAALLSVLGRILPHASSTTSTGS